MKKILTIFILLIIISGCTKQQPPSGIIPEDRFINYYVDFLLLDAQKSNEQWDSLTVNQKQDSLLRSHSLNSNQVKHTMDYYNEQPERWQIFFNAVVQRLESLQQESIPPQQPPTINR